MLPPSDTSRSHIEFAALLSIGLTLLGYDFIVLGLAGAVGGAAMAAMSEKLVRQLVLEQSISSVVKLVSGFVLVYLGLRDV